MEGEVGEVQSTFEFFSAIIVLWIVGYLTSLYQVHRKYATQCSHSVTPSGMGRLSHPWPNSTENTIILQELRQKRVR